MSQIDDLTIEIKGKPDGYLDSLKEAGDATEKFSDKIDKSGGKVAELGSSGVGSLKDLSGAMASGVLYAEGLMLALGGVLHVAEFLGESIEKFNDRQHIALGLNQKYVEVYEEQAVELEKATNLRADDTLKLIGQAEAMGVSGQAAIDAAKEARVLADSLGLSENRAIRFTATLAQGSTELIDNYLPSLKNVEEGADRVAEAHRLLSDMYTDVARQSHSNKGEAERYNNALDDLQVTIGEFIAGPGAAWTKWATSSVSALTDLIKWTAKLGSTTQESGDTISGTLAGGGNYNTDPSVISTLASYGPLGLVPTVLSGKTDFYGDAGELSGNLYGKASNAFNQTSSGLRGPSQEALKYSQGDPDAGNRLREQAQKDYEEYLRKSKNNPAGIGIRETLKFGQSFRDVTSNLGENFKASPLPGMLDKINDKFKEANRWAKQYDESLTRAGENITDKYLTPLERLEKQQSNLNELLSKGKITQETYDRALADYTEKRDEAVGGEANKPGDSKFTHSTEQGIRGLRAGSAEAIASIQARIQGGRAGSEEDKQRAKIKEGAKQGTKEGVLEGVQEAFAGLDIFKAGFGGGGA